MNDILERVKDYKTTAIAVAVFILKLAGDLGYTLYISVEDLSKYILYIIALGFLLTGKRHE